MIQPGLFLSFDCRKLLNRERDVSGEDNEKLPVSRSWLRLISQRKIRIGFQDVSLLKRTYGVIIEALGHHSPCPLRSEPLFGPLAIIELEVI